MPLRSDLPVLPRRLRAGESLQFGRIVLMLWRQIPRRLARLLSLAGFEAMRAIQ